MADDQGNDKSNFIFNGIFTAMGTLLLAVAVWIGSSVSEIPAIKVKLENLTVVFSSQLNDHETRLRQLEAHSR